MAKPFTKKQERWLGQVMKDDKVDLRIAYSLARNLEPPPIALRAQVRAVQQLQEMGLLDSNLDLVVPA